MLLPIALLLLHPQIANNLSLPAEKAAISMPAAISVSASLATDDSSPVEIASLDVAALPDAPVPLEPVLAPAPIAFINPGRPMKVSVAQLRAENRRKELMWKGLAIASSGAATFDAWSTRHAITTAGAQELNPLLRPFAGNASLYVFIQVGPVLMDYAGRKMMYSRHTWVRHMWWIPQSASFASSILCGSRNLSYH
jgi:hypothetical protein